MKLDHLAFRVYDIEDYFSLMTWCGYYKHQEFELFNDTVRSLHLKGPGPDIFVSEGEANSVVDTWVHKYGDGLHHLAFEVADVQAVQIPLAFGPVVKCPCPDPLIQVFSERTDYGFIIELIQKNGHDGFCEYNVQKLMEASRDLE